MGHYRVTKYDPRLRSRDGAYRRADWTSASDIGRRFAGTRLDVDEYERVEALYVAAIQSAAALTNSRSFTVEDFERHGPPDGLADELHDDSLRLLKLLGTHGTRAIPAPAAWAFARLALRELVWGRLTSPSGLYVHFGYDFYMYLGSTRGELTEFRFDGLFVEPFRSPHFP